MLTSLKLPTVNHNTNVVSVYTLYKLATFSYRSSIECIKYIKQEEGIYYIKNFYPEITRSKKYYYPERNWLKIADLPDGVFTKFIEEIEKCPQLILYKTPDYIFGVHFTND